MNPKHLSLLLLAAFLATHETTAQSGRQVPKLVVLLTVDQLRSDYLEAFSPLYGEDGLKKMLKEGMVYTNVSYPFSPVDRASAVAGASRFLKRVWRIMETFEAQIKAGQDEYDVSSLTEEEKELRRVLHTTIKKVTEDIRDRFMFNTAISSIMELVNAFYAFQNSETINGNLVREVSVAIIKLLAPFAPHITEELWSILIGEGSVHQQKWPECDEAATVKAVQIVLQINGKVRDRIMIATGISREEMEVAAKANARVQELTAGKTIVKMICVPDKLVNIVVK